MIDDSAQLPSSGRFYSGDSSSASDVALPRYGVLSPFEVSPPTLPLTLTECYRALEAAIRKARLIGFEIARMQKSFSVIRSSPQITLQGEARQLDEQLSNFSENLEAYLDVTSVARPPEGIDDLPLESPFRRILCAQDRFKRSNEQIKRSLLRVEKGFVQNVIEPLKQSFIRETIPPFTKLMNHAKQSATDVLQAGLNRQAEVKKAGTEVEASGPWQEVTRLAKTISDLKRQAEDYGWRSWRDNTFEQLGYYTLFDRADGPSSIIAYLENLVQEHARADNHLPAATNGIPATPAATSTYQGGGSRPTVNNLTPSGNSSGFYGPSTPSTPASATSSAKLPKKSSSWCWWKKRQRA